MKKFVLIATLISTVMLSGCGFQTVEQGSTGVKKTLGKVEESAYEPGLYFFNPFISSMTEMDNKVQKYEDKSNTYTKDVQQSEISYTVNYNLLPKYSVAMFSTVGYHWQDVLLPQAINGEMKNVIGKWNASDLIANREKAAGEIKAAIGEKLASQGVAISSFQLTNIEFRKEFEDAVEAKVVAIQKADEAKNQTVQVQEQANQRVIAAKADAEAMQIKTEALAKSQSLVAYEAVQKWNGVLPTMMLSGESVPFLQIPVGDKQ